MIEVDLAKSGSVYLGFSSTTLRRSSILTDSNRRDQRVYSREEFHDRKCPSHRWRNRTL